MPSEAVKLKVGDKYGPLAVRHEAERASGRVMPNALVRGGRLSASVSCAAARHAS